MKQNIVILISLFFLIIGCKEQKQYTHTSFEKRIPIKLTNPTDDTLYYYISYWGMNIRMSDEDYNKNYFYPVCKLRVNLLTFYYKESLLLTDTASTEQIHLNPYFGIPVLLALAPSNTIDFNINANVNYMSYEKQLTELPSSYYSLKLVYTKDLKELDSLNVKYYLVNQMPPIYLNVTWTDKSIPTNEFVYGLTQETLSDSSHTNFVQWDGFQCQYLTGKVK